MYMERIHKEMDCEVSQETILLYKLNAYHLLRIIHSCDQSESSFELETTIPLQIACRCSQIAATGVLMLARGNGTYEPWSFHAFLQAALLGYLDAKYFTDDSQWYTLRPHLLEHLSYTAIYDRRDAFQFIFNSSAADGAELFPNSQQSH